MTASNVHVAWARLLLRALASSGVADLVVSPGSRSTPVALAADGERGLRKHVVIDERSAGFFALGQARVTGRPTALLCTSGTAGAHYLPAVIEASLAHVPLVVITADRPWEAYDNASPQTIDQVKLFGDSVRHYAELGLPDPSPSALAAAVRVASQAAHRSLHPTPGPVHVNARFRKPLEPVDVEGPEPFEAEAERLLSLGAPARVVARQTVDPDDLGELAEACAGAEQGLIVAGPGPLSQASALAAAERLAELTGFPLLPEATSQLRFGPHRASELRCERFDLALKSRSLRDRLAPQVIVEIGMPAVSGSYAQLLAEHRGARRWVIAPHGWNDPAGGARGLVWAPPAAALEALCEAYSRRAKARGGSAASRLLSLADREAEALVLAELASPSLTEGGVAFGVVDALPDGSLLLVGNSMPVRDLDAYAPRSRRSIGVLHQRGASGIDGLISGAVGAASAAGGRPLALLLGDLSALHDVGGLAAARHAETPLPIVVVQNDGGRIFAQLPVAKRPEAQGALERYFLTPQGLSFEQAAGLFGLPYARVGDRGGLREALSRALDRKGATVIEAVVDPAEATSRRASLARELGAKLEGAL